MHNITATIGKQPYQTTLTNSRHTLIADENAEHNGKDLGPNPGELMAMSLASCTAITLRMYADRKQWTVDEIEVIVEMRQEVEKTFFSCGLKIKGAIGEEEKNRLLAIAKACPIHKSLSHPIEINTYTV
jgi:putative redox protein